MLKKSGSRVVIVVRAFLSLYKENNHYSHWTLCVYTDIGGGSVPNGTRNSLARIPLRWMIRQCFIAKTGIMFHKSTFPKVGLDPDTLYPEVLARSPIILQDRDKHTIPVPKPLVVSDDRTAVVYSDGGRFVNEAEEDLADALSPIYDQLSLAKYWWFLEWIPQTIKYQDGTTDLMVSELKYVTIYLFFFFSPSLLIGYSSLEWIGVVVVIYPYKGRTALRYIEASEFEWQPLGLKMGLMRPKRISKSILFGWTSLTRGKKSCITFLLQLLVVRFLCIASNLLVTPFFFFFIPTRLAPLYLYFIIF